MPSLSDTDPNRHPATDTEIDDNFLPMPPPRDPAIAVREEYNTAIAANTIATYELFISRHPQSPLVTQARARLAALR